MYPKCWAHQPSELPTIRWYSWLLLLDLKETWRVTGYWSPCITPSRLDYTVAQSFLLNLLSLIWWRIIFLLMWKQWLGGTSASVRWSNVSAWTISSAWLEVSDTHGADHCLTFPSHNPARLPGGGYRSWDTWVFGEQKHVQYTEFFNSSSHEIRETT